MHLAALVSAVIATVRAIAPGIEVAVLSPAEIAFRCRGLEFARARLAEAAFSAQDGNRLWHRRGGNRPRPEQPRAFCGTRSRAHPLWRLHPERWLETRVLADVCAIDERLDQRTH